MKRLARYDGRDADRYLRNASDARSYLLEEQMQLTAVLCSDYGRWMARKQGSVRRLMAVNVR